jgi:hypothetical protein
MSYEITPNLAFVIALITATLCLFLAGRLLRRAIEPIGALIQAVLVTMLAVVVIVVALAAVAAAALTSR